MQNPFGDPLDVEKAADTEAEEIDTVVTQSFNNIISH